MAAMAAREESHTQQVQLFWSKAHEMEKQRDDDFRQKECELRATIHGWASVKAALVSGKAPIRALQLLCMVRCRRVLS